MKPVVAGMGTSHALENFRVKHIPNEEPIPMILNGPPGSNSR